MISLITALYKSERYIAGYAQRIFVFAREMEAQGVAFELVLVPYTSSPGEQSVIAELAKYPWCRVEEIHRAGLYAAWNHGVRTARGTILGFWNVDDWRYVAGTLEQIKLLQHGCDLAYSPFYIRRYISVAGYDILVHRQKIDQQVPAYTETTRSRFMHEMHCGPFFMFTRRLHDEIGPFDEQFAVVADFEWCVRAVARGAKLQRAQLVAGSFRVDGRGASSGGTQRHMAENNCVYLRYAQVPPARIWPGTSTALSRYTTAAISYNNTWYAITSTGVVDWHVAYDTK